MYNYAIQLEESGTAASCRDLPEFTAMGNSREETLSSGYDNLLTTLAIYQAIGRKIPHASAAREGEVSLLLPATITDKIELTNALIGNALSRQEVEHLNHLSSSSIDSLSNFFISSDSQDMQRVMQALRKKMAHRRSTGDGAC